jgi:hypothetical protein
LVGFWVFNQPNRNVAAIVTSWPVVVLVWIGAPAFFGFLNWYRDRKRAQLNYLRELQRQLAGE